MFVSSWPCLDSVLCPVQLATTTNLITGTGIWSNSMKSTLLAAAGQLNITIEQRAKQGHHKQSVQLYSRDDVWPSPFLQRDILIDISTGRRPLTSQARATKQPLREPHFVSLPITEADLQLLQSNQGCK